MTEVYDNQLDLDQNQAEANHGQRDDHSPDTSQGQAAGDHQVVDQTVTGQTSQAQGQTSNPYRELVLGQNRQELIIQLYSTKKLDPLRKIGYIHYVSERMKYMIMYVDIDQVDQALKRLNKLHMVRQVAISPLQTMDMDFLTVLERYEAARGPAHASQQDHDTGDGEATKA
ncbi:hypothetical protein AWM75_02875 [Aerococcus urinaehominis]|uniref:Uncharacterized protein n=1 Tax=Aerococcus urinaehominis TaxID=128944 RepID=A0A0X8FL03_9LACT|nr:YlbG family protein [Aerococcus urinaehominis]AMB99004.1 hypothetical protein AWM75_02875 [Aerococcus urinaehominis]SDM57436.1 Uncharacterized protein YlbG, UPF0298 family [Aerococcus urinaehominis]